MASENVGVTWAAWCILRTIGVRKDACATDPKAEVRPEPEFGLHFYFTQASMVAKLFWLK